VANRNPSDGGNATVRSAFNKGDVKAMGLIRNKPMSILDGMCPHVWYGVMACHGRHREALSEGEHVGAFGHGVALGKPWHVNAKGNYASVVVPASMIFKLRGARMRVNLVLFLR
jgi:hypothetical protein